MFKLIYQLCRYVIVAKITTNIFFIVILLTVNPVELATRSHTYTRENNVHFRVHRLSTMWNTVLTTSFDKICEHLVNI